MVDDIFYCNTNFLHRCRSLDKLIWYIYHRYCGLSWKIIFLCKFREIFQMHPFVFHFKFYAFVDTEWINLKLIHTCRNSSIFLCWMGSNNTRKKQRFKLGGAMVGSIGCNKIFNKGFCIYMYYLFLCTSMYPCVFCIFDRHVVPLFHKVSKWHSMAPS